MVKKNYDNMLSRFHPVPERYGQTDGQMDRIVISISRVLTRDKNHQIFMNFYTQQQIFELDERHVIKNEKVAFDRLRVRQNVFLVMYNILGFLG